MLKVYQAYFINGPEHGTIKLMHEDLERIRVAAPPQPPWQIHDDAFDTLLKTGIYKRTGRVRVDPITLQDTPSDFGYYYEWIGWEK